MVLSQLISRPLSGKLSKMGAKLFLSDFDILFSDLYNLLSELRLSLQINVISILEVYR